MNTIHPLKTIFTKKLTIILLFVILVYIVVSIGGDILKYRSYQQDLALHKKNIDQLSQDNLQLSELLTFLNTDEAVDSYARTRLGLQQEGERAFIITEDGAGTTIRVDSIIEPEESNSIRWKRYFFD